VSTFTIRAEQSQLFVRATSSLHPITYSVPLNGSVEAGVTANGFDLTAPTHGRLWIDLAELKGDDPSWDNEMRDRLAAERYPRVVAELLDVTSRGNDIYRLAGTLTLHDTTRPLNGDAQVVLEGDRIRATGRVIIDIRDFGIEPPRLLLMRVRPEVEVAVTIVAETS
jgi:polyisoprenoid-binding protein YceI